MLCVPMLCVPDELYYAVCSYIMLCVPMLCVPDELCYAMCS